MGAALLAPGYFDKEFSGFAAQFLFLLIADDGALLSALGAAAILGAAGNDLHPPFQVGGQGIAPGMIGPGSLGPGQLLFLLGQGRFLFNLRGGDNQFSQEKSHLGVGELFTLGAPEPDIEEADLFVFEFEDELKTEQFVFQGKDFIMKQIQGRLGLGREDAGIKDSHL